jgi:hypothetical protein
VGSSALHTRNEISVIALNVPPFDLEAWMMGLSAGTNESVRLCFVFGWG